MTGRWTASWFVVAGMAVWLTAARPGALAGDAGPDRPRIAGVRVGFDGHYKVGYWTPVEVTLESGPEGETGMVELLVLDGDGVPTRVRTLPSRGVRTMPGRQTTVLLYAKFGRSDGGLTVRFVVDRRLRAERTYESGIDLDDRRILDAMPSTDELILTVGPPIGMPAAVTRTRDTAGSQTRVVHLADVAQLPTRWYGYEGVDTLVFVTSRPESFRQLRGDGARVEALKEWVRLGGRLVLFVAAEAAEVLSPQSALADLVPGRFDRMVPLPRMRALEVYCDASEPIELPYGMARPNVPLIRDVRGRIEAYEGNRPDDLPLVIRAPMAFGEVVLVLVDPDRPPLNRWRGRDALLRKVLGKEARSATQDDQGATGQVTTRGYTDLTGQLRDAMDQFQNIQSVPFSIVAGLVLAYILLIGPVDYFLVKKWFKRMELTWITFPLWVVLFSGGAYGLAYWLKGDQLRVNQAELVDIDVESGLVRGTTWTHLFSPRAELYDFSFQPVLPGTLDPRDPRVLLSWMGLPGGALGGMQAGAAGPALGARPYAFTPELDRLESVPIQVWSTKSIVARWTTHVPLSLKVELVEMADKMLSGEIVNVLGTDLGECHLLYDRWVYRIPSLPHGKKQPIGDALEPRYVKTWLQSGPPYRPDSTDVPRTLQMMMFHAAAGGVEYTHLLNQYQRFCDFSDLLKTGRAVLVARGKWPGSRLLRGGQSMAGPHDRRWMVYRFVIPVASRNHGPL